MYIGGSRVDLAELLPMFFAILIGMLVVVLIVYFLLKKKDDHKELISRRARILEKPVSQGNIAWYVVEFENGERMKLRSFQDNSLIISVGDVGILKYKGQTIQSFQRQ